MFEAEGWGRGNYPKLAIPSSNIKILPVHFSLPQWEDLILGRLNARGRKVTASGVAGSCNSYYAMLRGKKN